MKELSPKKRFWSIVSDNYSLPILLGVCGLLAIYACLVKGNVRITLNDNLDSNVPILKMFRDNGLFWKFDEAIPFLGGVVKRSQYKVELSAQSWIYILFPPLAAYYICFIAKVFFSGLGFFALGKTLKELGQVSYTDKNIWCFVGIVYGILGNWPHAAFGFASIPWCVTLFYLIYKTGKKRYIALTPLFVVTSSFAMFGIFLLFYIGLFCLYVMIRDKKWNFRLIFAALLLSFCYFVSNRDYVGQAMQASEGTIKSLQSIVYQEGIPESLANIKKVLAFQRLYHSGGAPLRYFVIPACLGFSLWLVVLLYYKKVSKKTLVLFFLILLLILFNIVITSFNNNLIFRRLIPFAAGFNFTRFSWVTPFLWLSLFALVCCYFYSKKRGKLFSFAMIITAALLVFLDPKYEQLDSMYNELYCNTAPLISAEAIDGTHEFTWDEFFSEELFDEALKESEYDGSWAVGYGFDPGVLQFNGIRTLDGYYSNYSLSYHDTFQRLIQPELDMDETHTRYWKESTGARAYCYSPLWDYAARKNAQYDNVDMNIDMEVFKEMGGKYIFSRYAISNAEELQIEQIGFWSMPDNSPYCIYLYQTVIE